jgi:hypothetical protein
MCVRNVIIPVLIQHFSNVTGRKVDLLNRSAPFEQIIRKVHQKSIYIYWDIHKVDVREIDKM